MIPPSAPFRLPRFDRLTGAERLDKLAEVVRRAERDGLFAPRLTLPGGTPPKPILARSRVRTIRTRLFLLGYLGRDNRSPRIGRRLQRAIHAFQREAGLSSEEGAGEATWTALQELLSFETPPDLGRWMRDAQPSAPLRRAAEVRLYILGLTESRHPKNPEKVPRGLENFVRVAEVLHLHSARLSAKMCRETLAVLFDQDEIARRLAEVDPAIRVERPARALLQHFMIANAQIELWLRGYDVPLGERPRRLKIPSSFPYAPEEFPFYSALVSFWQDCGRSADRARERAKRLGGSLFQQILTAEQKASAREENPSKAVYDALSRAGARDRLSIWRQTRTTESRIWDGIARAWNWLRALILRGVRKGRAWIRNTARLAYRYGGNAFRVIQRAFQTATQALRFFSHRTVPGSDPAHLVLQRDGDFDYLVFLNPRGDPTRVKALLAEFDRQAERFRLSLAVLGELARALVRLVRRTVFDGWFGFIAALVKLFSQRGEGYELFRRSRLQEALP